MSQTTDLGPAFPSMRPQGPGETSPTWMPGMTLRDWFAGQAMAGLLAHHGGGDASWRSNVAAQALLHADAVLVERDR